LLGRELGRLRLLGVRGIPDRSERRDFGIGERPAVGLSLLTLTSVVAGGAYESSWHDEMHATKAGFKAVAALIDAAIQAVAPVVPS
jgi:hypothetical protein